MNTYEIISVVISGIALLISGAIGIKELVLLRKNKITTKSLSIEFYNVANTGGYDKDWIHGVLSITNHTNKEFTIGRVQVVSNNKNCNVYQKSIIQTDQIVSRVETIKELRLLPLETCSIDFYIESKPINQETPATLSLITPFRKLDYPILLPKRESKNDNNKTKETQ